MKKFKRLIAILTVLLFALSVIAPAFAQDESATDESTGSVYEQAAKVLQEKGILKGNEQGDLMLDKSLTRAEILAMIIRATGQEDVVNDYKDVEPSFTDVSKDHWAFAYVEAGKDLGIVNGYPDGTFKPDRPVKFEELCKMLVAAKGESPATGKWPLNYVRKALELGFFSGIEDEVGIGDIVIRGQAAVAFANAFFQPEKTIVVKDVKAVTNDTIEVYVDAYLGNEVVTLEDGDVMPLDFEIKDASDETKTIAVTLIDSQASDFATGKLVLKTAAQAEGTTYKVYYKGQDTGKTFVGVPLQLEVAKVEIPNLKQVVITFNRDVGEVYAKDTANYEVKVGDTAKEIGAVRVSADKKVATLILKDDLANQDKVKVTVKKGLGLKEDKTVEVGPVEDKIAPSIVKVTADNPKRIRVEFSEPVKNYASNTNYTINDTYQVASVKGFAEDSSIDPNIIILDLYTPLNVGTHVLKLSGVTDIAGLVVVNPAMSFTVAEDKSPIELKNVTATLSEIKLEFSKAIKNILSVSLSNGSITGTSVDGNIVIIKSGNELTNCIPVSGAQVSVKVEDFAGQSATFDKYVIPTIDTERPSVKSVELVDASTIKIVFSKDVRLPTADKITVKDKDGNQKVIQAIGYDSDNKTIKVVLVSALPAGAVTVSVSGVEDNTPLKNASLPQTFTVTLADKTPPAITSVIVNDNSDDTTDLYITFDKTLDSASATTAGNYKYLDGSYALKEFTSAKATLQPNGKVVKLTIKDSDYTNMQYLQVIGVKDTNGNAASVSYAKSSMLSPTAAVVNVSACQAVSTTEIKVTLNNPINTYTLYAGDFEVKAGTTTLPILYVSASSDKEIVIKLQNALSADAKYNGSAVTLTVKANSVTKDLLGRSINNGTAIENLTVADKIAPTITAVEAVYNDTTAGYTYVTVKFSESVSVNNITGQFKVYINNTLTAPDSTVQNADNIVFKFSGDKRYQPIKVDYVPDYDTSNRVQDGNNNELGQTSVNATWKVN